MSPLTDAESFEFHPFQQTDGRNPAAGPEPAAQTQHRPLRASRCSFMSTVPSMNLRIFPNISPAPCPPVRLKPESRFPPIRSHRIHYPSPRPLLATRAAPEPLKNAPPPPPICLQSLMSFLFPFIKSSKIIRNGKPLLSLSSPCSCVGVVRQVLTHSEHSSLHINASWRISANSFIHSLARPKSFYDYLEVTQMCMTFGIELRKFWILLSI